MSMPLHLSRDQARRHVLTRQGLVGRYQDPFEAVRAMIAVQSQYPASVGPAIAARAKGVTAKWLDRALRKERTLLKGWSVRSTLHAHLAEEHLPILNAISAEFEPRYRRWMKKGRGLEDAQLDELGRQILSALEKGPLGRREIHEWAPIFKNMHMVGWGLDMMGLAFQGQVVLASQGAASTTFARLDQWKPGLATPIGSEEDALAALIRRYFLNYGPATYHDFLTWTQLRASRAAPVFKRVEPELEEVEVEGMKGKRYVMTAPGEALGSAQPGPYPIRLLPKFDALLMSHRDKSLFLSDRDKPIVFRPAGQVEATVLSKGMVSGTWRTQRKGDLLAFTVAPFKGYGSREAQAIEREAKLVAKSLGFSKITLDIQAAS